MNALQIFQHEKFGKIRAIMIDGKAWFVGKDAAAMLGYKDRKSAVRDHVNAQDKMVIHRSKIANLGFEVPNRGLTLINESGLYSLVLSSKLPQAIEIRHWVTSEVLPAIRKQGIFSTKEILTQILKSAENALENLCCVYVLEMENGTVKIGYTQNFINRARQISTSSGLKVINRCHSEYILQKDARMIESRCHQTFNEFRTLGEFFQISFQTAKSELERHLNISETMNLNA